MKKLSATKLFVYLFGIIIIGSVGSCMKDDNDYDYPQSVLTMVNGYVSASSVTYAADNNSISNLPYKSYNFAYLFPGSRRIRVIDNANEQLVDEIHTFKDSTYYTSFTYGWQEDVKHFIVEDQLLTDLGDQMGLRFLHLSPSEGNINVYIDDTSTLLYGDRGYEGDESTEEAVNHLTFEAQESGTRTIIITDENNETLAQREYSFEKGAHYSIILIGDSNSLAMPLYIGVVSQYR